MKLKDKYKKQLEITDPDEMRHKIESATTIRQMNELRMSCVELMKESPDILKKWQDKYWSLKNCPTCGHSL